MLGSIFYFQTFRKYIVAFGTIMNDVWVVRVDANNVEQQRFVVPLRYAPKEKYLLRTKEDPDLKRKVDMTLPVMSYEITNVQYDGSRHINSLIQNSVVNSGVSDQTQYAPVPYNIEMTLYISSRYQDDHFQIIEQIVPYFSPYFVLDVNTIPALNLTDSTPIVLNSLNTEDTFDGSFEDDRTIITTMKFTVKGNFYGPIRNQKIIKDSFTNLYIPEGFDASDANPSNSKKVFTQELTVTPPTATQDDVYTIIETDTEDD